MSRAYQKGQDRRGNPQRRRLEFAVVKDQVARRKAAFMTRLKRLVRNEGDCIIATCTKDHAGYPRMNFKFDGEHVTIHVMRVFMLLKRAEPIPPGYEVAHLDQCPDRRCVKHIELQHYRVNANTRYKRAP